MPHSQKREQNISNIGKKCGLTLTNTVSYLRHSPFDTAAFKPFTGLTTNEHSRWLKFDGVLNANWFTLDLCNLSYKCNFSIKRQYFCTFWVTHGLTNVSVQSNGKMLKLTYSKRIYLLSDSMPIWCENIIGSHDDYQYTQWHQQYKWQSIRSSFIHSCCEC